MPTKDTTSPKKAATPAPAAAPAAPAAPSAPAAQPTGPIINQAAAVELLTQMLPIPYPAALVVLVQAVSAMLQASMLIVGIPALIFLVKVVNKYEDSEPWRTRQKLRRATYAIGATLLVITLLGTMVQMVFSLLVAGAGSNVGATVLRVLISSIISLTVVGGALYALVNFSRQQNASTVRTIFIAAVAIAVVMVPFALYQVYTKGVSDSSSSRSRSSSESLRDYSTGSYRSRSGSGSSWSDL